MTFKEMIETNTWHDGNELQSVVDQLKLCNTPDPEKPYRSKSGWQWSYNPGWRAKYVGIVIDMRDGGFILQDRNGKRISLAEILEQRDKE